MTTVSLKLPEGLHKRLVALARKLGKSKSEVVREALEAFLDRSGSAARGSCLDRAGELTGCLEGPKDLSHSPRHMKDYGR